MVSMRNSASIAFAIFALPATAYAQTGEDVAWAKAAGCQGIRQFVKKFPNTRFVWQVQARLISLNCLKPAGSPGRIVNANIQPPSALALLEGVAPPPIGDLLDQPVPTVSLINSQSVGLTPCPERLSPKEQCRTDIVGIAWDGKFFALNRTGGELIPWNFRDGEKERYSASTYGSLFIFDNKISNIANLTAPPGVNDLQGAPMEDIAHVVFLSDRKRVVTQGSIDGWSFPWNLSNAKFGPGGTPQGSLKESPNQKYLFATSVGAGNYCSIYSYTGNYESLNGYTDPKKPNTCSISYFNSSQDSEILAVGYTDDVYKDPEGVHDTVAAVRWREGKSLLEVPGRIGAISPTGSLLAVWGAKRGRALTTGSVYDLWSGKRVFAMTAHSGGVTSMAWSPDSERLATGGADAILNLWNARTGLKIGTFGGFPGPVCEIQFTANGRGLITQCEKVVRIYDAATGQQVKAFVPGADGLLSVAVSSDGSTVVEVRDGGKPQPSVNVWKVTG